MNLNSIAKKPFFDLIYSTPCMPQLLRLAFNDAINGGPNGSIRLAKEIKRPENIGLKFVLKNVLDFKEEGNHITEHLSYADLIQLGGYAAIEYCGGPFINFRMGREDVTELPSESRESALSRHNAYD